MSSWLWVASSGCWVRISGGVWWSGGVIAALTALDWWWALWWWGDATLVEGFWRD